MRIDRDTLNNAMKQRGWSLPRLAKESGVAYSTLWSMGRGERQPQVATVKKVADALGLAVTDLEAADGVAGGAVGVQTADGEIA